MQIPDDVAFRQSSQHGADVYDCTDALGLSPGDAVQDTSGRDWTYQSSDRMKNDPTSGVYHVFKADNGIEWHAALWEDITARFPALAA